MKFFLQTRLLVALLAGPPLLLLILALAIGLSVGADTTTFVVNIISHHIQNLFASLRWGLNVRTVGTLAEPL